MDSSIRYAWPAWCPASSGAETVVRKAAAVTAFCLLIAAGAHMRFYMPGNPVPVTLQTLFVLLAACRLSPAAGLAAVGAYLALGCAGAPFFAVAGGLVGPTGGYLAGFMLAPLVAAGVLRGRRNGIRLGAALILGAVGILCLGWIHLAFVYGMGPRQAWNLGVLPFLPGDTLKTSIALLLCGAFPRR